MKYLSLFSGIEAATCAWHPLGWDPIAYSEIDKFPRALLAHYYPNVPLHGDMTDVDWSQYRGRADVVVGGSPCQSFSVAGLRKGLADPRGNLTLSYLGAVDAIRPKWMVWENVPGILSDDGGRTFGAFVGALGELGYGFAYRILDAQYFGLAQRRKRLFVVGYLGDWRRAAAVLFDSESLSRNPAPRRETRKDVAPTIGARTKGGGGLGTDFDLDGGLVAKGGSGRAVRRLTPRECERLQGFPDDYTLIPYRGKPATDSPRYKAIGNSMAVPVMRWIGERIDSVDGIGA